MIKETFHMQPFLIYTKTEMISWSKVRLLVSMVMNVQGFGWFAITNICAGGTSCVRDISYLKRKELLFSNFQWYLRIVDIMDKSDCYS